MSFTRYLTGSVMIVIFAIAIFTFAVNFANDNDSDISINDDSRYSDLNATLRSNLSSLESDAEESRTFFLRTTLEQGDEHAGSGAQYKIGPFRALSMASKTMRTSFNSLFGPEFNWIILTIAGLLTFLIGYYAVQAWLGRNP